jgi:hypothetical protein
LLGDRSGSSSGREHLETPLTGTCGKYTYPSICCYGRLPLDYVIRSQNHASVLHPIYISIHIYKYIHTYIYASVHICVQMSRECCAPRPYANTPAAAHSSASIGWQLKPGCILPCHVTGTRQQAARRGLSFRLGPVQYIRPVGCRVERITICTVQGGIMPRSSRLRV